MVTKSQSVISNFQDESATTKDGDVPGAKRYSFEQSVKLRKLHEIVGGIKNKDENVESISKGLVISGNAPFSCLNKSVRSGSVG